MSTRGSCCEENQADGMDCGDMTASASMVREGRPKVALELRLELWGKSHCWWRARGNCESRRGNRWFLLLTLVPRDKQWGTGKKTCCSVSGRTSGFHPGSRTWPRHLASLTLSFLICKCLCIKRDYFFDLSSGLEIDMMSVCHVCYAGYVVRHRYFEVIWSAVLWDLASVVLLNSLSLMTSCAP